MRREGYREKEMKGKWPTALKSCLRIRIYICARVYVCTRNTSEIEDEMSFGVYVEREKEDTRRKKLCVERAQLFLRASSLLCSAERRKLASTYASPRSFQRSLILREKVPLWCVIVRCVIYTCFYNMSFSYFLMRLFKDYIYNDGHNNCHRLFAELITFSIITTSNHGLIESRSCVHSDDDG